MALLGELFVNLTARTDKFEKGMRKGKKELTGFQKSVDATQKSMKLMKTAFVAFGTFMAGAGIVRSIKDTAEAMDQLGKTATRLGLTAEALGGLRHAAEQTGVEVRTFDMALQRMVRRVAEAAKGTGEAKDALIELELSAQKLAAMSADQQFIAIADAMRGIEDQSDRVRIAFKLFDSEGVKLLNTLEAGKTGLTNYMEEAKKLGSTITDKEAKRAAKFVDEMDRLSKLTGGFKQDLVISVTPAATEAISGLRLLMDDIDDRLTRDIGTRGKSVGKSVIGRALRTGVAGPQKLGNLIGRAVDNLFDRQGPTFRAPAIQPHERMQAPQRANPLMDQVLGFAPPLPGPEMSRLAMEKGRMVALPTPAEQRRREQEMIEWLKQLDENTKQSNETLMRINEGLQNQGQGVELTP